MNTNHDTPIPADNPIREKGSFWGTVLKIVLAVATALAGAFGLQSCLPLAQ